MKTERRIDYIKKWILDYCKSMPSEAKTLVVGISGGIDSSVVSTICALTKKKTIVLMCFYVGDIRNHYFLHASIWTTSQNISFAVFLFGRHRKPLVFVCF